MRRLIFPFQMITDHCFLLWRTHARTNDLSSLSTSYKQVCVWKKGKHLISRVSLLISNTYISSAWRQRTITEGRVRAVLYLFRILIHNDHFRQQWQPQTIRCHINLSSVESGQWKPVMKETSPYGWYIFLITRTNHTDIWNEFCQVKEHRQHNSLGSREEKHLTQLLVFFCLFNLHYIHHMALSVSFKLSIGPILKNAILKKNIKRLQGISSKPVLSDTNSAAMTRQLNY